MWYLYVILVLLSFSKSQIRIVVSVDIHFVSFLFVYITHICISIYIYSLNSFWFKSKVVRITIACVLWQYGLVGRATWEQCQTLAIKSQ